MVGNERPGGSNRGFGGIRRGLTPSEPLTGTTDLDIVNYDIGNLNYYLHSGSGGQGATNGKFRWIYGQRDVSIMELDKDGTLTLPLNALVTGPLFSVGGKTELLGDVTIGNDSDLIVTGIGSFTGDVNISGTLSITELSIAGVVTFTGVDTDTLLVGSDPLNGGQGTLIEDGVAYIAGVASVTNATNELNVNGDITAQTITTTETETTRLVIVDNISGPGSFGVNSLAEITATSISITGTSNFGTVISGPITASDIASPSGQIDSLVSDTIQATTVQTTDITSTGSATLNTVTAGDVSATSVTVDNATFTNAEVDELQISNRILDTGSGEVNVATSLQFNNVGIITQCYEMHSAGPVRSQIARYAALNDYLVQVEYQDEDFPVVGIASAIVFRMYSPEGNFLGAAALQLDRS